MLQCRTIRDTSLGTFCCNAAALLDGKMRQPWDERGYLGGQAPGGTGWRRRGPPVAARIAGTTPIDAGRASIQAER
jgi:hypothetical protein